MIDSSCHHSAARQGTMCPAAPSLSRVNHTTPGSRRHQLLVDTNTHGCMHAVRLSAVRWSAAMASQALGSWPSSWSAAQQLGCCPAASACTANPCWHLSAASPPPHPHPPTWRGEAHVQAAVLVKVKLCVAPGPPVGHHRLLAVTASHVLPCLKALQHGRPDGGGQERRQYEAAQARYQFDTLAGRQTVLACMLCSILQAAAA